MPSRSAPGSGGLPTASELPHPRGWRLGRVLGFSADLAVYEAEGPSGDGLAWLCRKAQRRPEFLARAQALSELQHHQVVGVLALGEVEGLAYRLDASAGCPSARIVLQRQGALAQAEVLEIGIQLAHLLAELHSRGLVHGAVDLDALRLDRQGSSWVPLLGDFPGLHEPGKEPHAAPEVQLGAMPDPRSDLFGLGYVMASLLRGSPPDGVEGHHPSWQAGRPGACFELRDLPPALDELLMSLVDRSPGARPASADEVAAQLARMRGAAPSPSRWWPWALGIGALVGVGVAVAVALEPEEAPQVTPVSVTEIGTENELGNEIEDEIDLGDEIEDEIQVAPAARAPTPKAAEVVQIAEPDPEPVVVEVAPEELPSPEEPAAEEPVPEEPPPPTKPDVTALSGAWTGELNKRPVRLVLSVDATGSLSGTLTATVGAQDQVRPVSGSIDPATGEMMLSEDARTVWIGELGPQVGSGLVTISGRNRGSWSLSR